MDFIANRTLSAGTDLESDHPGFNDPGMYMYIYVYILYIVGGGVIYVYVCCVLLMYTHYICIHRTLTTTLF